MRAKQGCYRDWQGHTPFVSIEVIIMVDLSASRAQAEVDELRAGSDIGTSYFINMRSRKRKRREPTRDSDVRSANLRDGRGGE
jgi:hypothetical protein